MKNRVQYEKIRKGEKIEREERREQKVKRKKKIYIYIYINTKKIEKQ